MHPKNGFRCMGTAIAGELLRRGCNVRVYDQDRARLELAYKSIRSMCTTFHQNDINGLLLRFSVAYCLQELLADDFHIVIEATPEVLHIKQAVFREVAAILKRNDALPDKVLLRSNTISIPMDQIATGVAYPCIALRFRHPVCLLETSSPQMRRHPH